MRNLILFAIAFSVSLSESDVEELGMNVSEIDFKDYFGIPKETEQTDGFVKSEGFNIKDLEHLMNEEELASAGVVAKPVAEAAVVEKPVKEPKAKVEKTSKTKEEKETEKAEAKAKKEADKAAKASEPKKPGVIASILEVIKTAKSPVNENDIVKSLSELFPDKTPDSMRNTVRAQIGGKTQPVRMEQEKNVTFVITEVAGKEGEKSTKLYSLKA